MLRQLTGLLTLKFAVASNGIVHVDVDGSTVQQFEPEHNSDVFVMNSMRAKNATSQDALNAVDANGRLCLLCSGPLAERTPPNVTYTMRTDCGNHSVTEALDEPLINFKRDANETHNATFGWCELNSQKVCADAIWNKDILYQARAVDYPRNLTYDPYYCFYNGWLAPEIRFLQNNFSGMMARAGKECDRPVRAQHHWNTSLTMRDMMAVYGPSMTSPPFHPNREEALFIGSWNCAMGTPACDMAYCAYSFCVKAEHGDGTVSFGMYEECDGWDPVEGMPVSEEWGTWMYARHG